MELDATGTFHLTNAGECSWYEFAREVLELTGSKAQIEPIATESASGKARRPDYSCLASKRLVELGVQPMRHRSEALMDYLKQKSLI